MFPSKIHYYMVMAADLILRFMWVLTLVPPESGEYNSASLGTTCGNSNRLILIYNLTTVIDFQITQERSSSFLRI